ncbi:hypothetical protein QUB19_29640, partial [Microcoleus sp. B4-C5]
KYVNILTQRKSFRIDLDRENHLGLLYNLLGHALRKAVSVIAAVQGREPAEIASEAGAPILNSSSLKTALDLNWDNPVERQNALSIILNSLASVEEWMQSQSNCDEFEAAQDTL